MSFLARSSPGLRTVSDRVHHEHHHSQLGSARAAAGRRRVCETSRAPDVLDQAHRGRLVAAGAQWPGRISRAGNVFAPTLPRIRPLTRRPGSRQLAARPAGLRRVVGDPAASVGQTRIGRLDCSLAEQQEPSLALHERDHGGVETGIIAPLLRMRAWVALHFGFEVRHQFRSSEREGSPSLQREVGQKYQSGSSGQLAVALLGRRSRAGASAAGGLRCCGYLA
jgi:hypothetical protein